MGQQKESVSNGTIVETLGEFFADGHRIEIVSNPSDKNNVRLLHWNGHTAKIGTKFRRGANTYRPAAISFLKATRLPNGLGKRLQIGELFSKISTEFRRRLGLPDDNSDRITFFCISSWFADILPILPSLWISGPDPVLGIEVMRLIGCFCRRPLLLGTVTRGALDLVAEARPTLLIFDRGLNGEVEAALQAFNYRGLLSLDSRGLQSLSFSKAVFSLVQSDPASVDSGVLQVSLGAANGRAFRLSDDELTLVSDEYQQVLLTYRLSTCKRARKSQFDVPEFTFPTRATAAALGACLDGNSGLTARLIALLRWQDNAVRGERYINPHFSIVEVLLGLVHRAAGGKDGHATSVSVQELASLLNALVRSRGGNQEYSAEEVGWILKRLCIPKARSATGMQVVLGNEISRRVHSLACDYDVSIIKDRALKCSMCQAPKENVGMQVM